MTLAELVVTTSITTTSLGAIALFVRQASRLWEFVLGLSGAVLITTVALVLITGSDVILIN